jgi:hypothetical protein
MATTARSPATIHVTRLLRGVGAKAGT